MSSSLVEYIRSLHQENETNVDKIIRDLSLVCKTSRKNLTRNHRVKKRLELIEFNLKRLISLYEDNDKVLTTEFDSIHCYDMESYLNFRSKIDSLVESYRDNPTQCTYVLTTTGDKTQDDIDEVSLKDIFSASERNGKMVDLTLFHHAFLNLGLYRQYKKHIGSDDNWDYVTYLRNFDDMFRVLPYRSKLGLKSGGMSEYSTYLDNLIESISNLFVKIHPLVPFENIMKEITTDIEIQLKEGTLPGYFPPSQTESHRDEKEYGLLVSVGADSLGEEELTALTTRNLIIGVAGGNKDNSTELYCKACEKQFSKQTIFDSHLTGKKHIKNQAKLDACDGESNTTNTVKTETEDSGDSMTVSLRNLAVKEHTLAHLTDLLRSQVDSAIDLTHRRQTMSLMEIEAEEEVEDDDEEEDEVQTTDTSGFYNPKNVPVGWNGEPIPMWMYKLHGLNISYKCEVCGGDSYRGERNYLKHFKEWKHTYNLKCLGITNSNDFINVNTINEALLLHERMKKADEKRDFNPQTEEEMEDAIGNLYTKEEYEKSMNEGLIY